MPPRPDTSWDDEDDGLDYELEPPDEDVVRSAEDRAREEVAQAERAVDVDAVYRKLQGTTEDDYSWEAGEFRFGIREMLVATGVVALLLGIWRVGLLGPNSFAALIAVSLVTLGSAHTYLAWRERKRRDALVERQSYELARARGELSFGTPPDEEAPTAGAAWDELKAELRQNLRFGIREMMILTALTALLMVPVRFFGADGTAALVGLLVLTGLAIQVADYELPKWAYQLWWLLILAYCLLMLGQAVASALGFV